MRKKAPKGALKPLPIAKGHKAALNYLEARLEEPLIQERIGKLRDEYEIKKERYADLVDSVIDRPPTQWKKNRNNDERASLFDKLARELDRLLHSLDLYQRAFAPSPLLNYIFTDQLIEMDKESRRLRMLPIKESLSIGSLVFYDVRSDRAAQEKNPKLYKQLEEERRDVLDRLFPVAIRINPNASWQQLRSDIAKALPLIKLSCDQSANNHPYLWKKRTKSQFIKERDDLIHQFTGKPNSWFFREFAKRFPTEKWPSKNLIATIRASKKKNLGSTK